MSFSVTGISLVAARTQLPEASPTFMALLKDLEEGRKLKVVFALNNEYKRAAMSEEELLILEERALEKEQEDINESVELKKDNQRLQGLVQDFQQTNQRLQEVVQNVQRENETCKAEILSKNGVITELNERINSFLQQVIQAHPQPAPENTRLKKLANMGYLFLEEKKKQLLSKYEWTYVKAYIASHIGLDTNTVNRLRNFSIQLFSPISGTVAVAAGACTASALRKQVRTSLEDLKLEIEQPELHEFLQEDQEFLKRVKEISDLCEDLLEIAVPLQSTETVLRIGGGFAAGRYLPKAATAAKKFFAQFEFKLPTIPFSRLAVSEISPDTPLPNSGLPEGGPLQAISNESTNAVVSANDISDFKIDLNQFFSGSRVQPDIAMQTSRQPMIHLARSSVGGWSNAPSFGGWPFSHPLDIHIEIPEPHQPNIPDGIMDV